MVVGHFGNSEKSACAKNAQAEIVLIRPNSADLDYVFQQSGNKLREVVFNSGEFARIRLICAFFLFILQCAKIAHSYLGGIPPN